MEPEEIIKLSKLEDEIDQLYDAQIRKIYGYMFIEGESVFEEGKPLNRFVKSDLLERIVKHFESTEEYEKCAFTLKLSKTLGEKI